MSKWTIYILLFVSIFSFSCNKKIINECGKVQKILKSDSLNTKYDAGVCYYDKEDYYRASLVFDEISPLVIGTELEENVEFFNANCYYNQKNWYYSSYYFKKFADKYPRSINAEEAYYLYVKSLQQSSPSTELDQESTHLAINACQSFVNRYPNSKYVQDCNKVMDELQMKLEVKAYDNAYLYFKIMRYKAAVVALGNFTLDYPASDLAEKAFFFRFKAQYLLAEKSAETIFKDGELINLKLERYEDCTLYYREFIDKYSDSKMSKEAENLYDNATRQIQSLKKNIKQ